MGITLVERSGESQEKIVFKIENVAEFFRMSNEELERNGIIIEAGNCTLKDGTQVPAAWKYSFEHIHKYKQNYLRGFIVLHRPSNIWNVKSAMASFSLSLSSGGKLLKSSESEQKELAGTCGYKRTDVLIAPQLLEMTKATNTLELTLVVKVFSSQSFDPVLKIIPSVSAAELKRQANSDLVKMLKSGDWSDVDVTVKADVDVAVWFHANGPVPKEFGRELNVSYTRKAHKNILTARSSVFAKMFAEDSTMNEAVTGEVFIKDLSPEGLDIFLRFLYTGEVLQDWVHVVPELLNAAEKYDCDELKQYCGGNILAALSTSNALELYKLTKLHGLLDAAETVLGFISKNTKEVIDQVVQESK